MKLLLEDGNGFIDTNEGIDLSISVSGLETNVRAWYLDAPKIEPVQAGDFVGSVAAGAPVNFRNIFFNPHAHGTHTENLGHITLDVFSVNSIRHPLFYSALLVTIEPKNVPNVEDMDLVITIEQLKKMNIEKGKYEALIVRTLPNLVDKKVRDYGHSNPAYFEYEIAHELRKLGILHLLVDLPSVDKEKDDGILAFHHAFWSVPDNPDHTRTITEFIYVPDSAVDGDYFLNLQVAPFENDASISRPVIYKKYVK